MKVEPVYFQRIREAKDRGYYVTDDGVLVGIKGKPLSVNCSKKQKYPTFSTNWGGQVFGIPVHKFAAYCFFGEAAFEAQCVRHVNGDRSDFSRANLTLGTFSENELDKSPEDRRRAATMARAAQGAAAKNRKLTPDEADAIRTAYRASPMKKQKNGFRQQLADHFGVSTTTIHKITKGHIYVC